MNPSHYRATIFVGCLAVLLCGFVLWQVKNIGQQATRLQKSLEEEKMDELREEVKTNTLRTIIVVTKRRKNDDGQWESNADFVARHNAMVTLVKSDN